MYFFHKQSVNTCIKWSRKWYNLYLYKSSSNGVLTVACYILSSPFIVHTIDFGWEKMYIHLNLCRFTQVRYLNRIFQVRCMVYAQLQINSVATISVRYPNTQITGAFDFLLLSSMPMPMSMPMSMPLHMQILGN